MSIIHRTTLSPSKYDLLAAWLPAQPWFAGDVARLAPVGAYRFDDPEGEVGLEGHVLTAGDEVVYHVPLAYRGAALDDGDDFVVGTMEHGVLGTRWAYDAIGDPVFRAVLSGAIVRGEHGSREFTQDAEGNSAEREPSVRVRGTGSAGEPVPDLAAVRVLSEGAATIAETEFARLAVHRAVAVDAGDDPVGTLSLRGEWPGAVDALLASLTV
ncbi:maltokinase N-terminal cap-like domain-containing protein [Leucobacter sp. USHLN154]|uniref:maltokinase N-terminal cap-like domain-containing protein n=1 Tax=Leucobacter sp. USHLN154 TaxID=3081269 RepID=UPI0030172440